MSSKVAAVIIACNEEHNIRRCLESVLFCDDVILVDSGSTDRTLAIAREVSPRVRIEVRSWTGYADQKNFALGLTSCQWILSVDADEEVTEELRDEVKRLSSAGSSFSAYTVPRKTIHFGRWIRHGGWYPNRLVRVFEKAKGEWRGGEVHERWVTSGHIGEFQGHLLHYSFDGLADQVERNNHYSTLGALRLKREGYRFSTFRLVCKTVSKFVETYFLKLGLLDGYPGFIISVSAAYSVFLKWAKLWELECREV